MESRRVLIAVASGEHAGEVSGRCDGRTEALAEGFARAGAAIDSGAAAGKLESLARFTSAV